MSHAGNLGVEFLRGLWVMPLTEWILSAQTRDAGGTLITGIHLLARLWGDGRFPRGQTDVRCTAGGWVQGYRI